MIKKIIALSVSFVLMLASVLYGVIDFDNSPVSFGAGDGVAKVIETPAELQELLSNIPSLNDYLENEKITDVNPDFKSFTMIEDGKAETRKTSYPYRGGEYFYVLDKDVQEHSLEICFGIDSVYYHCIGSQSQQETTFESNDNQNHGDFVEGTRNVTSYDVEIYYSKDVVLVKYNDYSIKSEKQTSATPERFEEIESDDPMQTAVLSAISESFGQWMRVEDRADISDDDMSSITDPNQMFDAMIYYYCDMFSEAWIANITQSTEGNVQYLVNLSDFITDNLDSCFRNSENNYTLKDDEEVDAKYFAALGLNSSQFRYETSTAYAGFNLNSDTIVVDQEWNLDGRDNRTDVYADSSTTFRNIDNTMAAVKDAESVDSVYDVLSEPLKALLEQLMTED